jgi:large subunit ribosomal protein L10
MLKSDKERIVGELTERLQATDTLIVADYRGMTMKEVDALRGELLQHGARFTVVKNSLTRRAAEAAGAEAVLTLLDGPTAIAFLETDGDPVAVAKALAETARTTKVLAVRGGLLEGRAMTAEEVEELAKLPPVDLLRGQVLGAVAGPLYAIVGLFAAPLQDLHGLLQARIEQLGGEEAEAEVVAEEPAEEEEPAPEASADEEEPAPEASAEEEEPAPEASAEEQEPATEASAEVEEEVQEETTEAAEEPAEAESEE